MRKLIGEHSIFKLCIQPVARLSVALCLHNYEFGGIPNKND